MNTTKTTRPLAERITQTKVTAWIGERGPVGEEYQTGFIEAGGRHIAKVMSPSQQHGECRTLTPQQCANIELILESFTVAHETGKTPRQLADERAELIAALKDAREALTRLPDVDGAYRVTCIQQADELLAP